MEFVVATGKDDDTEREVYSRLVDPQPSQVREALLGTSPIPYGTHFLLLGSPAGDFLAICTSGPEAPPSEDGEFLLYLDNELVAQHVSRTRALDHLLAGLGS